MTSGGADLHLHSVHSDGTYRPARLIELAAEKGLQAVSLTDHDTVSGVEEAQEAGRRLGVRVLTGVEISAEYEGRGIHLLAYGFDPAHPSLFSLLQSARKARDKRCLRMMERLNALGIPVTHAAVLHLAEGAPLGRPHVAEALLRGGVVSTLQGAFDRFLNPGRPAHVPLDRIPFRTAREAVEEAGGLLVLAHPHLNLALARIRALVEEGVDGVEVVHPKLLASQGRELRQVVEEKGILGTGGSDCHGERRGPLLLGTVRLPMTVLERIDGALRATRGAGEGPTPRRGERE